MKNPLPSGPSSLCFNKEEFMKSDFNVESFVVECRRRVALETLRDDLSVYLKILQSAMIELINKDYADFVNLSTNLVGMDKAINNLMSPMNQLRSEVLGVRAAMDDAVSSIEEKLQQKNDIREKKSCLQRLINIIQCVEKMESLLGLSKPLGDLDEGKEVTDEQTPQDVPHNRELSGQLIERVATEFNKLQFFVNKSRGLPLVEEIRPRVMNITTMLQYSLEGSFKEGLESGNVDVLTECLRTYATIDKMRDAENLFRQHIVKPGLETIISEQFIKNNPQGLNGMYDAVLEFIPKHCKLLREVTAGVGGGEAIRGYDFMVNSVWPEVVTGIENRIPSIFAPGNPAIFHERYLSSMSFLDGFERQCGSQASVKHLRSHPSYNTFMAKWSLPVYFQIRFQEIAGDFEAALVTPFTAMSPEDLSDTTSQEVFHQHVTAKLWECLHCCWKPNIYLQPLSHRFWKLTLQLLARYAVWLNEIYHSDINPEQKTNTGDNIIMSKTISSVDLERVAKETAESAPAPPPVSMSQIVCLISDVQKITSLLKSFFQANIKSKMTELGVGDTAFLEASMEESVKAINDAMPQYGAFIVQDITNECLGSLKTVSDIPRLYRRTNRDLPSKASSYITAVIQPIAIFLETHGSVISEESRKEWITTVLQNISDMYLSVTTDVLTSVRKMEESLKRLKKSNRASSASSQGVSDDDKIRLQLYLDVTEFGTQIKGLGIDQETLQAYDKLYTLVQAAKSGTTANA